MSKVKIEIKNRWMGNVLFEYEAENNTLKETLEKAVEKRADLEEADLREANLEGANLRGANLRGADLEEANLEGANLRGAYLEEANLRGANLRGADLEEANLRGAYLLVADYEIDEKTIIEEFEKNTNIKLIETYMNHDVIPTRWSAFWRNGLIIRKWETKKEVKEMTVEEISKALGYEVKIVKEKEYE